MCVCVWLFTLTSLYGAYNASYKNVRLVVVGTLYLLDIHCLYLTVNNNMFAKHCNIQ